MNTSPYDNNPQDIAWCPGCGNFGILTVVKQALEVSKISPHNLVLVSGIGQAAKMPHYLNAHFFNGLHGRALPAATAIKASNPSLTVIAESGDGDMYGEGGNHFIHAVRRNPGIVTIVHNNMVYGLTKGQASPTSQEGFVTPLQVHGVHSHAFNPIAVALTLRASFVARCFIGDAEKTRDIIVQALRHHGYALIDILQPCVTFNKVNTFAWFKNHTYYLEDTYSPTSIQDALRRALEPERFALGVFFADESRPTFEETVSVYNRDTTPLYARSAHRESAIIQLLHSRR